VNNANRAFPGGPGRIPAWHALVQALTYYGHGDGGLFKNSFVIMRVTHTRGLRRFGAFRFEAFGGMSLIFCLGFGAKMRFIAHAFANAAAGSV